MEDLAIVEVLQAFGDVCELKWEENELHTLGGEESRGSHEAEPVHRVALDKIEDVPVHHELGDHKTPSGLAVDIDCDEPEDIGM